jgi:hypothetical protein
MPTNRAQRYTDVVEAYEAYRALMRINEAPLKSRGSPFLELIENGDDQAELALKLAIAEVFGPKETGPHLRE